MGTVLIDKLLQTVINLSASDLHITVGQPPVLRLDGHMRRLETKVLEPEDTTALMKSITPERCQVELQEVTGEMIMGEYTIVRELEIGGIKLKNMPVVFADSHAFRRLNLDDKPALLLGMNALRSFHRVSIDFQRKKLKVLLPEESALHMKAIALR